ncbi:lipid A deacylase LpxR family protein [Sulfurimonas aquatica]|nr:lipid A deacylase LpxR family protein [Sulfurimonas aquatica]
MKLRNSILLLLIMNLSLFADSSTWTLKRFNLYFENDTFAETDNEYTGGYKLSNVYYLPSDEPDFIEIPFLKSDEDSTFFSVAVAQQIYTPKDTESTEVVLDERPYSGWTYLELGMHYSCPAELDSLVMQVGVVGGRASGAEQFQKALHSLISIDSPKGWDNQLEDELGLNLIYQHKWRYTPEPIGWFEQSYIPFGEVGIGNVKTYARTGILMRIGLNPAEDFGSSSIDIGGENGIPIKKDCLCLDEKDISYTLNLTLAGEAVVKSMLLDGNLLTDSHSVEKEPFVANASFGFSARYEKYELDFIYTINSKKFKKEKGNHKYGSVIFSYLY